MDILTQIYDFQHGEKPVLKVQVLRWRFGTVVFNEGKAAGSEDLVVATLDTPVEAGQAELVVVDGAVADTEGGPRGEPPLQQVGAQHLRGRWTPTRPAQ